MSMSVRTRVLLLVLLGGLALLAVSLATHGARLTRQIGREAGGRLGEALLRSARQLEGARDLDVGSTDVASLAGLRFAALVDADGRVVSATPFDLTGKRAYELPLAVGPNRIDPTRAAGRLVTTDRGLAAGGRIIHRTLEPSSTGPPVPRGRALDLVLVAEVDDSPRLAAGRARIALEHAGAALAWGIVVLVLWRVLEHGLARPARRVAETLERLAAGEVSARTGMSGNDEIAAIGAAFDRLVDRMRLEASDVRNAHALLEATLETLPVGVLVARREDGRPLFVNSSWCRLYGKRPDPARDVLSHLGSVRCERADGSVYQVEELAVPTALRTGGPTRLDDVRLRREDGAVTRVDMIAIPLTLHAPEGFDAVLATIQECPSEPATAGHDEPAASPPERPRPPRSATVLVVEDEADLCDIARHALSEVGYRVLTAADGSEALAVYRRGVGVIDAVVLDLTLPDQSGRRVLDELLAIDPDARVILASGYHPEMREILSAGRTAAILAKPYGVPRLLAALRSVLERRSAASQDAARG